MAAWDFVLPPDRIAVRPPPTRDGGRLLVVPREGAFADRRIVDLPSLLAPGDLLVANDSRVMAARLEAHRASGGRVEVLLLGAEGAVVPALLRPARRLVAGEELTVAGGRVRVVSLPDADGIARVACEPGAAALMEASGALPLPPYLGRGEEPADRERYQTVFAAPLGSSAAPTAGLHLTPSLLAALAAAGVGFATVTLHVGIGTFRPPRPEDLARGELHPEPWWVPDATARAVAATRARGGRVIAVGTTSARVLESAAGEDGLLAPGQGTTRLFVRPGHAWRAVDGLLTNLHLPRSSLLLLVGALLGRERTLAAYEEAVTLGYRFYSYGDAMLLLPR
ncbi:MAG: tRNA preQ1(34) S-adenosylmethionine ribosyltransferase-isomerase QueA [Alphaproteobacteria bacterium]|nr:tRNA preQ1(34) S-adenosylmethionine ribosyltransferase-isomerase QueA [Alphaproteobacteria bacterium]